jgi:hypothetical protein
VAAWLAPEPNEAIASIPYDEKPYWHLERARIGKTRDVPVEVVVNANVVARRTINANGSLQNISLDVPINRSSWIALRILYSSHTNPIFVIVGGQPIRASRRSAQWCLQAVKQCWSQKESGISVEERPVAAQAYKHAAEVYKAVIAEAQVP